MVVRRKSCPIAAQRFWVAISVISSQKQVPNMERIQKYMQREYQMREDTIQSQLKHCVKDGLLVLKLSRRSKGSNVGAEQDSYRHPEPAKQEDSHDWYCFRCHEAGDVQECDECHRVYHDTCIDDEDKELMARNGTFVCRVCKELGAAAAFKMTKSNLNYLLAFTCIRLKDRGQHLAILPEKTDSGEEQFADHLIYHPMDITQMENRVRAKEYCSLDEFQIDAENILHNVVILYGARHPLTVEARDMLSDCQYDIREIRQCRDCYRLSNEKTDRHWFCRPCRPPHKLVYARQKGFQFWPAKVINQSGILYDVRFFGAQYERAIIDEANIRPVSSDIGKLQIKRTSAWKKAYEELCRHREMLKKVEHDPRYVSPKFSSEEEEEEEENDSDAESSQAKKTRLSEGDESEEEETLPPAASSRRRDAAPNVHENIVSSSSQEPRTRNVIVQTPKFMIDCITKKAAAAKDLKEAREKLLEEFEMQKQEAIATAIHSVTSNLEKMKNEHRAELASLAEKHKQMLSDSKKKQWCYNCEVEAIYHCCWNTAYCSTECQQNHWQREHKRMCRRKR